MSPDSGLDRLLDRSVVLGYSRLGYSIRKRHWAEDDPKPGSLVGRTALVTGAGGGLGEATALELAMLGARVHLLVRSPERAAPAVQRITDALRAAGVEPDLHIEQCDMSDLAAVDEFTREFRTRDGGTLAVDILVHNAGVMPPQRTDSVDGHEQSVATHVLGPLRLTERLIPAMRRSRPGARVIMIASGGMYAEPLPVDDPDFRRGDYRGTAAYARSKRMQVEFTPVMARRWEADRISMYTMHPGWADTPGVAESLPRFRFVMRPLLRSARIGVDTTVWLAATDPAPPSGTFWHDRQQRPTSYRSATRPDPARVMELWHWAMEASGLEQP